MNQSLAPGLEIPSLFESTRPVFTVPEMVERLRFSLSKAYRLIRVLVSCGLLERQNGDCKFIRKKSIPIQKGVSHGRKPKRQIDGQFVRFDP